MATKKKNRTTRAPSELSAKGHQAKARKVHTVAAAAATQAEPASAETDAIPITATPEPAPAEAEATAQVEAVEDQTTRAKKRSALDAAVQVLEETGQAMNCQELIAVMAAKGYWSSPKGRTPASTLYSAILRELQSQGEQARFVKTERGKFARRGAV